MRKPEFGFLFAAIAASLSVPFAQPPTPPPAFSYQALVRDGSGQPVRSGPVSVRIRLHQDSAYASVSYAETFTPTTNGFGNINLSIGLGTVLSGNFSVLDWSRPMYVEIGVDITGGTTYADLGTTQLLSVPYAMYAGRSATTTGVNISEIHDADNNTKVSTERNANENIVRFDLNGTEKMRLTGNRLEFANIPGNSLYIGDSAGANSTGPVNLFIGYKAGRVNTTGSQNTFAGHGAGYSNTTGSQNTFAGTDAGFFNTTGSQNTFAGAQAGSNNTTGYHNTFAGSIAGFNNTTGNNNTFAGYTAGRSNTTGGFNTFSGYQAGYFNTTGDYNTFSGPSAGFYNTAGSFNTYIGFLTGPGAASTGRDSFSVAIGYAVRTNGSNMLAIDNSASANPLIAGDFAANTVTINGSLTVYGFANLSDRRIKENIAPLTNSLDGVGKLNGVYYNFKKDPEGIRPRGRQIGVIAQDVEKVYPELVSTTQDGLKAVDYPKLTAVLIEAVKEQQKTIESLKAGNVSMAARMEKVEAALRISMLKKGSESLADASK